VRRSLLLLLFAVPLGCGVSILPHNDFDRLPRDARQEIFDAENDLVIAKNREDAAEDKKRATLQVTHDLDLRWQRTTKRLTAAGQAGKLPQAKKVLDAEEAYLNAEVQVQNAEIQTSRVETELSRARLTLVRQRELARIGRVTGASLKPLEADVKTYETQLKAADATATTIRTRAEGWLEAWKAAEDEYARGSGGDYDTVVWVD
jgi:hypothetical protein